MGFNESSGLQMKSAVFSIATVIHWVESCRAKGKKKNMLFLYFDLPGNFQDAFLWAVSFSFTLTFQGGPSDYYPDLGIYYSIRDIIPFQVLLFG